VAVAVIVGGAAMTVALPAALGWSRVSRGEADEAGVGTVPAARPTSTLITTTTTPATVPTTTTTLAADRPIGPQAFAPMAIVGDLTILHPSARVERVGWHESSLDGALTLTPLPTAVAPATLRTRDRGHGARTAADVVSDPNDLVRAPVTGTVAEAGPYLLYCSAHDDTVVIIPDGHPDWRVRVLHIDGVRVVPGWHVAAGDTVIAARPRPLPFPSQIDRLGTVAPPWPHVHVEVDDAVVPDTPSDGDSCPERTGD
jgi:hypothetical protein